MSGAPVFVIWTYQFVNFVAIRDKKMLRQKKKCISNPGHKFGVAYK